MATNLGTAVGYLTLDITDFSRGIDQATREMERMGTSSGSMLDKMGTGFTKAGTALTATVTAPIVGFGASILREGTSFEEAMTQVKNVANLANSDIDDFRQAVAGLGVQMIETGDDVESMYKTMYNYAIAQGSETRYTAEEVAQALYYMGLAGWKAEDMMKGLRPILDLAAATGEDLGRVSDIVTDSMSALGISIDELSDYTNVLAEMTRSSNTTLDQAGEAFKYVSPLAGAMGYTMEDLAIAIGEFANVGVKGSQAGTGLRQAINNLTNPGEKAQEVLDRLNWSIYDMYGNAKPLGQVMEELRNMFQETGDIDKEAFSEFAQYLEDIGVAQEYDAMSTREQIDLLSQWANASGKDGEQILTQYQKVSDVIRLVGIRALPGMLGIINETDDRFGGLTDSVYSAHEAYGGLGTSAGMAAELMDTTQGSIYKLTSSLSELKIQLFELLGGPFRELVDNLTEAVKWFNSLDESTKKNVVTFAGIAAAVGPALLAIGGLLSTISQISTAFSLAGVSKDKFSKNITGTLNPALGKAEGWFAKAGTGAASFGSMLVGGLAIVTGAVTSIYSFIMMLKDGWSAVYSVLMALGEALIVLGLVAVGAIAGPEIAIAAAVAAIIWVVANLIVVIKDHWNEIVDWWNDTVWPGIMGFSDAVVACFQKVIDDIIEIIMAFVDFFGTIIDDITWFVFEFIPDVLSEVLVGITNFYLSIYDKAHEFGMKIGTAIREWLINTYNNIREKLSEIVSTVTEKLSDMWNSISTWFTNLISNVAQWFDTLIDNITNWFTNLVSNITQWFNDIMSQLSTLVESVLGLIKSAGETIMNGISNVFDTISSGIETLSGFFISIFTSLMESVKSALSSIASAISEFISGVVSTVSELISTIMEFVGGLASFIGSALMDILSAMKGFFDSFIAELGSALDGIGSWVGGVISQLSEFISGLWDNLTSMVSEFGSGMAEMLASIGSGITEFVSTAGKGLTDFLGSIGESISGGISNVVNSLSNGFNGLWGNIVDIGRNIVMGIWEGIKAGASWVANNVGEACNNILNGIKNAFQIGSPSKVMANEVGRWLPPGIVKGFEDAIPDAEEDINDSLDELIDGVNADGSALTIGTSYDTLQTVMADSYSRFADSVQTTEERLNASLDSMYEKMYSLVLLEQQLNGGIITNTGYGTNTAMNGNTGETNTTNNNTGNTFIFNSPKAIDEIEAARQMEKTQREMEEGFI